MILLLFFLEISAVLLIGVFCHVICSYALHNALFNQCALSFPPAGELQDTVNILNRSQAIGATMPSYVVQLIQFFVFLPHKTMGQHYCVCVGIGSMVWLACL